jgi:hypothetical protein
MKRIGSYVYDGDLVFRHDEGETTAVEITMAHRALLLAYLRLAAGVVDAKEGLEYALARSKVER